MTAQPATLAGAAAVPTLGCVLLTTGQRPDELARAIASVHAQRDVTADVVVVVNAEVQLDEVPGARLVHPGENLGIPGGRNLGVETVDGEVILFLDDDAELGDPAILARLAAAFGRDPSLGIVTMRLVDPVDGRTERRHVPRLRVGDPLRGSWVTTFLGGASLIRREVFDRVGRFPDDFFYAHEETSLAWRALDVGYRIRYDADAVVLHPAIAPSRHAEYHWRTARNRVLLARTHLPLPVALVYLAVWATLSLIRPGADRATTLRGFRDGARAATPPRWKLRWATILRMALLGRPPIV